MSDLLSMREQPSSMDRTFGDGALIINADDWGRDVETTDRILECVALGAVSSASAMVFMEDSERGAGLALSRGVDVGLHLNLTTLFSSTSAAGRLIEHQGRLAHFLLRSRLSPVVYHPGLADSFRYVVSAQLEEFCRIYNAPPRRVDGHHHMHLCANVIFGALLPGGIITRRNFSFQPGEKSGPNRLYRRIIDRKLARRYRLADSFFSLAPLEPSSRLAQIVSAARSSVVEVETHPINPDEYKFLTGGQLLRWRENLRIAPCYTIGPSVQ